MSARAISEASGKRILNSSLEANCGAAVCRFAAVTPDTDWDKLAAENGWLNSEVRVVLPGLLIFIKYTSIHSVEAGGEA